MKLTQLLFLSITAVHAFAIPITSDDDSQIHIHLDGAPIGVDNTAPMNIIIQPTAPSDGSTVDSTTTKIETNQAATIDNAADLATAQSFLANHTVNSLTQADAQAKVDASITIVNNANSTTQALLDALPALTADLLNSQAKFTNHQSLLSKAQSILDTANAQKAAAVLAINALKIMSDEEVNPYNLKIVYLNARVISLGDELSALTACNVGGDAEECKALTGTAITSSAVTIEDGKIYQKAASKVVPSAFTKESQGVKSSKKIVAGGGKKGAQRVKKEGQRVRGTPSRVKKTGKAKAIKGKKQAQRYIKKAPKRKTVRRKRV